METRNVTLTLKKARECITVVVQTSERVALQAYTKDELEIPEWQNIKTFEDACIALNIDGTFGYTANTPWEIVKHLRAIWKLDIIRKALNGDWKPSLVRGSVYYPYVKFYPASQKEREAESEHKEWKLGESFKADGKKYTLVKGGYSSYCGGLTDFSCGYGTIQPYLGLLSCKNREIAKHMSLYFSKEIFEATYAYHVGTYQWV